MNANHGGKAWMQNPDHAETNHQGVSSSHDGDSKITSLHLYFSYDGTSLKSILCTEKRVQ